MSEKAEPPLPPDASELNRNRVLYFIVAANFLAMLIYRVQTNQITGSSGWMRALFLMVSLSIAYDFLFSRPIRLRGFTVPVDAVGVRVVFFVMAIAIVVAAVFA